jgi:putative DNA primase/helicase
MRRREISVLIIHHSAKSGGQRGTSRREDVLDTVIRLQWPADYTPSQGARFEVHLTKGRNVSGDPAEPFEATLAMVDGQSTWAVREIIDDRLEQAAALFEQNISVREAGVALGISKSAAGRLRQRLIEEGSLGGKLEMEGEG